MKITNIWDMSPAQQAEVRRVSAEPWTRVYVTYGNGREAGFDGYKSVAWAQARAFAGQLSGAPVRIREVEIREPYGC